MDTVSIKNERPIIGILTAKPAPIKKYVVDKEFKSYIAASYVKYIEGTGARVVPIMIGKDSFYYEDILNKINGVLLPGGAEWYTEKDGYADAGEHIYRIAKEFNDQGIYFPIFGICLGFELLIYLSAGKIDNRKWCNNKGFSRKINFENFDYKSTKMFEEVSEDVISIFSNQEVATFFHQFCFTEEVLSKLNLDTEWKVSSTSKDDNGLIFINSIESIKYPFYGVQFHPEKNAYSWNTTYKVCHSADAIKTNRYFGDFFVGEARKNNNTFDNKDQENKHLIYNYEIVYTLSSYMQCYIIPDE
ncbi:gamma-glutamyl hydrolase-like [Arctopsyche grandis]|uniref:gamma-glutamyl hydrolase-like n=1 Tax=Arctopsyche grandis TaxID=121162 RepID=UPI00406DA358